MFVRVCVCVLYVYMRIHVVQVVLKYLMEQIHFSFRYIQNLIFRNTTLFI